LSGGRIVLLSEKGIQMSALAILSAPSQAAVKSYVDKHTNSKVWHAEDWAKLFAQDKAITVAHLIAVGLKGQTKIGEAMAGYIKSVCAGYDLAKIDTELLGENFHRISVVADLSAMDKEIARVAALYKAEQEKQNAQEALDGTATFDQFTAVKKSITKARTTVLVESDKNTTLLMEIVALADELRVQYLGNKVQEKVSA
jgi:predicted transcriptional regulator